MPSRASYTVLRVLGVFVLALHAHAARADLWAYVDERGHSHLANHPVDARYKLFFKGETTLDLPNDRAREQARAAESLHGTRLQEGAIDQRLVRRFDLMIETHARNNGLDPALVKAVVAVESGFDPLALSPKGAVGLMQVIPDTGERYGLTGDARQSIADKLRDPATNVRIGARYLRDLLVRFSDDLSLALAAYNAGEGNVALHGNTIPPFAETRDFVKLVQQVYALYRPAPATPAWPVRLVDSRASTSND
jgi:soluble lytic murein transglycosylase-like protein